jgi:hypothetical protein
MRPIACALASVTALIVAAPAWAHHSHAMYDAGGEIELEGSIKEVRWFNPHVWLYIDVRGQDGQGELQGRRCDQDKLLSAAQRRARMFGRVCAHAQWTGTAADA